jgi:hypothetical protein
MDALLRALVALTCLSGGAALLLAALFGAPRRRGPRARTGSCAAPTVDGATPRGLSRSLGCLHGANDYAALSSRLS